MPPATTLLTGLPAPLPATPSTAPTPPVTRRVRRDPEPAARETTSAGAVLAAVRRAGHLFRDGLVGPTGLSAATANRQVVRLVAAGLLRERPDLAPTGVAGRPRVPVEVDPATHGVLGVHIGRRHTTLAVGDLTGRVLAAADLPTPRGEPGAAVRVLTTRLRRLEQRFAGRTFLQVGVVIGGQLSADRARLRHAELGWESVPLQAIAEQLTRLPVAVVPQAEAIAHADMLRWPDPPTGTVLHVYAREAVAAVLTVDGNPFPGAGGPGTIAHLPVGVDTVCGCGARGCLEATVADSTLARAAVRAGILSEPSIGALIGAAEGGDGRAHAMLVRRGEQLGRGLAMVRDVLAPDRIVLAGQAATAYQPAQRPLQEAFARRSVLRPMTVQLSGLGHGLQAAAACTAAVRRVVTDPFAAVAEVGGRRAMAL